MVVWLRITSAKLKTPRLVSFSHLLSVFMTQKSIGHSGVG